MYPVALYDSLPEIAYPAPCGRFRVHGAVEEESIPGPTGRVAQRRSRMKGVRRHPVATPMRDQTN